MLTVVTSSLQASGQSRKAEYVSVDQRHDSQETSTSLDNDSMLLPHDRVGSDFSWLQAQSQEDPVVEKTDELDDEESFLYGNEDGGGKRSCDKSTPLFPAFSQTGGRVLSHGKERERCDVGSQQHSQNKSIFSAFGDLLDINQQLQITSSNRSANLDSSEFEETRNILKSLGTTDTSDLIAKMRGHEDGTQESSAQLLSSVPAIAALGLPALNSPSVRKALESLQSLIKGENPFYSYASEMINSSVSLLECFLIVVLVHCEAMTSSSCVYSWFNETQ